MYAIRPDGDGVELLEDGTWSEVATMDLVDHPTEYSEAKWVSEYDFDQRTLSVTRVVPAAWDGWRLSEVVRDADLSDPEGRFDVFVAEAALFSDGRSGMSPGEIVKVAARLSNDGYLAAWRADFSEDPIFCTGALWANYLHGGLGLGRAKNHMFRHWTYAARGEILRTPTKLLRTWTEAHSQWIARRRRHQVSSVPAVRSDGVRVELHGDGTWTEVPMDDFNDQSAEHSEPEWISEYDFNRRTVTLTRVPGPGARAWPLNEIVRAADLSDPDGRFEVFIAPESEVGLDGTSRLIPEEIVKVAARLDDDGYFSAWHPDFCQDPIVCEGTLWGLFYGGYRGPLEEMPKHWIYVSRGDILQPFATGLRTWAEAHRDGSWLKWRADRSESQTPRA